MTRPETDLVRAYTNARFVVEHSTLCTYETRETQDPEHPLVTISGPFCVVHGGTPPMGPQWGDCTLVDPQIPELRRALENLLNHLRLDVQAR